MHTSMYIYIFIDVGSTFTVYTVNHVILPRLLKYQGPSLYYVSKETGPHSRMGHYFFSYLLKYLRGRSH